MAFYVKLGPRGFVFRLGTLLIGAMGSVVYWRACRRRGNLALGPAPSSARPIVAETPA